MRCGRPCSNRGTSWPDPPGARRPHIAESSSAGLASRRGRTWLNKVAVFSQAVATVQVRSGLLKEQQVTGLIAGPGGRALIICPSFVREHRRHGAVAGRY